MLLLRFDFFFGQVFSGYSASFANSSSTPIRLKLSQKFHTAYIKPLIIRHLFVSKHHFCRLTSLCLITHSIALVQLLEMLSEDYGGRVELAKAYYKALTASVKKHFKGNGVIASMEHCNDFMLLGTEAIALGRVGNKSINLSNYSNFFIIFFDIL